MPGVATLRQPDQPTHDLSLPRRNLRDCLAEELRRLDPDELYGEVITSGLALLGDAEAEGVRCMTNERRVLVHPDKASLAGSVAARFITKMLDLLDEQAARTSC